VDRALQVAAVLLGDARRDQHEGSARVPRGLGERLVERLLDVGVALDVVRRRQHGVHEVPAGGEGKRADGLPLDARVLVVELVGQRLHVLVGPGLELVALVVAEVVDEALEGVVGVDEALALDVLLDQRAGVDVEGALERGLAGTHLVADAARLLHRRVEVLGSTEAGGLGDHRRVQEPALLHVGGDVLAGEALPGLVDDLALRWP
jgi:hypothetical protein